MTLNLVVDYLKVLPGVNGTIFSNIKAHNRVILNKYILKVKRFLFPVITDDMERDLCNRLFLSILIYNFYIKNKWIFSNTDDLLGGFL